MHTVHISSLKEDIAKTVIMPGDPLRAKFIAENYLEDYRLVNSVRNCLAYTGKYKNKDITIFSSGMGNPSVGIYSYELYKFYDVDNIIRIGSASGLHTSLDLYDLVLVSESYSESTYALNQSGITDNTIPSSEYLNKQIQDTSEKLNIKLHYGKAHCCDSLYREDEAPRLKAINEENCIVGEMESFALFANALTLHKQAACIVTVSMNYLTHEESSSLDRQNKLKDMALLALETAINL